MRNGSAAALVLGAILLHAFVPSHGHAQAVRGRVLDMEAGSPIVLGRMTLLDAGGQRVAVQVTDAEGRFLLVGPAPGEYWIEIESPFHHDYSDGPISLAAADTVSVTFELAPLPVELDDLTVEAEGPSMRLAVEGVYDRMEAGIGVHFDRERIRARPGTRVSDLIALLPMVELRPDPLARATRVLFRRRQFERLLEGDGVPTAPCFPQVFLDGAMLSIGGSIPTELDQFSTNDLQAVEVYESPAGLPTRFHGTNAHCGTIVLWTR
jgi:hypothetical protein